MSEEEAIKICKSIINDILGYTCFVGYTREEYNQAIKTLLELYNKQKEEIKELKSMVAVANKLEKEIKKKFISKDKIRKEIEETEEELYNGEIIQRFAYIKIETLKELLEE